MPRYLGKPERTNDKETCTGVLLTNLGTPDAPTTKAVRQYLSEFLADPRVVETSRVLWWPILHGLILRTRPQRSAAAYQKIWTQTGSPLLDISRRQARKLQQVLEQRADRSVKVVLAMRYGNPSIASALEAMRQANIDRLLVLPLYPQYSAATTASTFDAVAKVLKTWRCLPELRMINGYHDHPSYIRALAEWVRAHGVGNGQRLLFSFHGIPLDYSLAGDPYHSQCKETARLVVDQLHIPENSWKLSFQSRFGPRQWLKPYTDHVLREWAATGVKNVSVICPGFSADCLETLEEIDMRSRQVFLQAGGETFSYIPALNDGDDHINALVDVIGQHMKGWPAQVTTGSAN